MLIPVRKVGAAALSLLFLLCSSQLSPGQNKDIQPPPDRAARADDGVDVQARGPVHEACAQPCERNPGPTAVVPKKPPAPVPEEPPDQKPKGDNVQWIPGYWAWDTDKNDFLWVSGYWDYPLADRGLLFAPARFNQPLWQTPGWFYRPSFVIGFDGLFGSLFVGRRHRRFFFGDYYDPFYARAGFWPWYSYGRRYHDPLFSYYNWRNHGDPNWYAGLRNNYWGRRNGDLARPPQTFAQQSALLAAGGARAAGVPRIVTPLNQVALNNNALTRV